jgi:hypothetical protein
MHHFPPAAVIGAVRQPPLPKVNRVAKRGFRFVCARAQPGVVGLFQVAQNKRRRFAFPQYEIRNYPVPVASQLGCCCQPEAKGSAVEASSMLVQQNFMLGASVVEGRTALQPKRHSAVHNAHSTNELIGGRIVRVSDRHVIGNLTDAVGVKEFGDQNIGVRPVMLFLPDVLTSRRNAKSAAFLVVQDGGEYARRIEVGHAKPVNRAIHANHCRRVQIANSP